MSRTITSKYSPEFPSPKQPHDISSPRNHAEAIAEIKIRSIPETITSDGYRNFLLNNANPTDISSTGNKYASAYAPYCGKI